MICLILCCLYDHLVLSAWSCCPPPVHLACRRPSRRIVCVRNIRDFIFCRPVEDTNFPNAFTVLIGSHLSSRNPLSALSADRRRRQGGPPPESDAARLHARPGEKRAVHGTDRGGARGGQKPQECRAGVCGCVCVCSRHFFNRVFCPPERTRVAELVPT